MTHPTVYNYFQQLILIASSYKTELSEPTLYLHVGINNKQINQQTIVLKILLNMYWD